MSTLKARIKKIDTMESLNIVTFDFYGIDLKMMSLSLGKELKVGRKVLLAIKPSSVALAKDFNGEVSYANKIDARIVALNNGELLSCIELEVQGSILESLITCEASKQMKLEVGDNVIALLKASELSISEILS